jgi:cobalt-zinc-cadmium efflux system membrane fusion protein
MTQGSIVLLSMVFGAWVLGGCGQTDAPAAASTPAAPLRNLNVVRIPLDSPQIKQLRVESAQLADLPSDELVAPGRVAMNPNRVSRVLPPVGGRVLTVLVKFGDHVEQGQPLLTMDSPDSDAAVSAYLQAQSTERQTRATFQKAETDFQRTTDLYEHKAVAEKDLLQAQNDLASAKSGYDIAQAVREQTWRKLQLLELKPSEFRQPVMVRAPLTGQVLEVNVAPGEYRGAISFHTDTTAPLMTIADLSTVWVSSDVPEPFIPLIHVGESVTITLVAFPDQTLTGRVARLGDVLDAQTRTLKVHVELPNPVGRFRPEMYGTIRHSGPSRPTLVVPAAALIQEYGRSVVFVERGPGRFERREVATGVRTGGLVSVSDGLAAEERVVVDGAILLKGQ